MGVVLSNLPMESATSTRLRDEVPPDKKTPDPTDLRGQRWDLANYQLQALRNDIQHLTAVLTESDPPDPLPIPKYRPSADEPLSAYDPQQIDRLRRVREQRGWEDDG